MKTPGYTGVFHLLYSVIPARFAEASVRRAKAGIQVNFESGFRLKAGMTDI